MIRRDRARLAGAPRKSDGVQRELALGGFRIATATGAPSAAARKSRSSSSLAITR